VTRTLASDVLLIATAGGLLAVGLVCWDCLVFLIRTRMRGQLMTQTSYAKDDIVQLTTNGDVETDRGVLRWYAAGTHFRVLGPTADGYARCRDNSGCRVLIGVDLLSLVRSAAAAAAGNAESVGAAA
jgi:hypothetical protein